MDFKRLILCLCLSAALCGCAAWKPEKKDPARAMQDKMNRQQGEEPPWNIGTLEPDHLALARDLVAKGHYDVALIQLEKADRNKGNDPEITYLTGICHREQGDLEKAVNAFNRALTLNPDYAPAHYGLGLSHIRQGDAEAAVVDFSRAVRLNPARPDFQNNLGYAYMEQDRLDLAEDHFRKSLALEPDYRLAQNNLAVCRFLKGEETEALALLMIHNPPDAVYGQLAAILRARGEYDRALELTGQARQSTETGSDPTGPARAASGGVANQTTGTAEAPDAGERAVSAPAETEPVRRVKASPNAASAAVQPDTDSGKRFSVQVAACLKAASAQIMITDLKNRNYDPYIFPFTGKDNRHWHLVRIGDFNDWKAAEAAAEAYRRSESADAVVTRYDSSTRVVSGKEQ